MEPPRGMSTPMPPLPPESQSTTTRPRARARRLRRGALVATSAIAIATILAVVNRAASRSTPTASSAAQPSPSSVVAPPLRMRANPGAFRVGLTWDLGTGDSEPVRYQIYRDGVQIGTT